MCVRLSLSREYGTLSLLWCMETHFCGIRYFFFWVRGEEIHESISSSNKGKNFRKRSLCTCTLRETKKYLDDARIFFQINIHPRRRQNLSLSSHPHSFLRVSFFIHTRTTERETHKKKRKMPARSAIAMGGADVMTFVRSTRPGFPKGLKVRD